MAVSVGRYGPKRPRAARKSLLLTWLELIRGPARRKWCRWSRFVLLAAGPVAMHVDPVPAINHLRRDGRGHSRPSFRTSPHGVLRPRPQYSLDLVRRALGGRRLGFRRYPTGAYDRGPAMGTGRIQHCRLHLAAVWL